MVVVVVATVTGSSWSDIYRVRQKVMKKISFPTLKAIQRYIEQFLCPLMENLRCHLLPRKSLKVVQALDIRENSRKSLFLIPLHPGVYFSQLFQKPQLITLTNEQINPVLHWLWFELQNIQCDSSRFEKIRASGVSGKYEFR